MESIVREIIKTGPIINRFYEDHMPAGLAYEPEVENILQAENFGADKLYLYDDTDNKNSYKGNNLLYAAYLALNIPWRVLMFMQGYGWKTGI